MAARKQQKGRSRSRTTRGRTNRRRGKAGSGSSLLQRMLVGLSGVVLVMCAASISYGLFIRGGGIAPRALRVEVLNGTGVVGLAHRAKRGLHRRGVDVIGVGNAGNFDYEESILIARRKGGEVRELGELLGCRHVVEQLKSEKLEDATLILGKDYRTLRLGWELESDLAD